MLQWPPCIRVLDEGRLEVSSKREYLDERKESEEGS
jgi:hypothetical protein